MQEIVPFSGNPLDRASNQRRDAAWPVEQVGAPDTRFVAFWRLNLLPREVEQPELCWLDAGVWRMWRTARRRCCLACARDRPLCRRPVRAGRPARYGRHRGRERSG